MENTDITKGISAGGEGEKIRDEIQELVQTLPREKIFDVMDLYLYQGFWYPDKVIQALISFQQHFQAQDSDVILCTLPKAGTTWLKALTFSIVNRVHYPLTESPLLTTNPHKLIPFFELDIYLKNRSPDLDGFPSCPRILSTHAPFVSLPSSIKNSSCRIVYLCRNPLDQFISHWHFSAKIQPFLESLGIGQPDKPISFDEGFDMYCRGLTGFGPFLDHTLGYWKASLERPDKILFLKYEDMKEDIIFNSKQLAEFLGCPFSTNEERGVIEEIAKLCSFENMKELEVNKIGIQHNGVQNDAFFRKGGVGDWANYLTPSMVGRMKKLMEEKLGGSGLAFQFNTKTAGCG